MTVNQRAINELTRRPALFDYHSVLKCVHFACQLLALAKEWILEWLSHHSIYNDSFPKVDPLVVGLCAIWVRKDIKQLSPTITLASCLKALSDHGRERGKPQV